MIRAEDSAKAIAALHIHHGRQLRLAIDQVVVKALMIVLQVVVLGILLNSTL